MPDHSDVRRVASQVVARLVAEGNALALDPETAAEVAARVAMIMETVLSRHGGVPRATSDSQSLMLGQRRAAEEIHPSASLRAASIAFEEIYPALLEPHEVIQTARAIGEAVALQEVVGGAVFNAAIGYVDYLLSRLSSVHLQERRALAAYLHDHTAQVVASAIQRLEYTELPRSELKSILETALEDIRSLAFNLRQYVGEQRLDEALEAHLIQVEHLHPIVALHQRGVPRLFSPLKQETSFLIAREAVVNARKHAEAQQILVNLLWSELSLEISIKDDGKGFDQTKTGASRMGLLICRERAESMSAEFEIDSELGAGTTVTLSIPL